MCNLLTASTLQWDLERFWRVEEVEEKQRSVDEQDYAENHFRRTHSRDKEGRFEVELPQNEEVHLGDSYPDAFRRLLSLERRFSKNKELHQEYERFLADYERSGHMTQQGANTEITTGTYYIPHQPVIKTSSLTTKLRVVFDASAKTSYGTSLNDRLVTGPNIQNDIFSILARFRLHEFVITADITQMFRQINVATKDRNLQKILWRRDPDQPIKIYTLNTVTYGTACAPFLAMRCLRELAQQASDDMPEAARVINEDFYMDDLLTGGSTVEEVKRLQGQTTRLLKSGQFELRKWRANDAKILQHLEDQRKTDELLILNQDSVKTLGLLWNN